MSCSTFLYDSFVRKFSLLFMFFVLPYTDFLVLTSIFFISLAPFTSSLFVFYYLEERFTVSREGRWRWETMKTHRLSCHTTFSPPLDFRLRESNSLVPSVFSFLSLHKSIHKDGVGRPGCAVRCQYL